MVCDSDSVGARARKARAQRYRKLGLLALMLLSGCGGEGSSSGTNGGVTLPTEPVSPVTAPITVSISGLRPGQQITLTNNDSDTLVVTSNGTFSFSKPVALYGNYAVVIKVPPSVVTCTLGGAADAVRNSSTISVTVRCGPTILHSFSGPEGSSHENSFLLSPNLLLSRDGSIYGTIGQGGTYGFGTIFSLTPAGELTVLHHFAGGSLEGWSPEAALVEGPGGDLYGTTVEGGSYNGGTIFKISRDGTFKTLHFFSGFDVTRPKAALVRDGDDFYGTAFDGGMFGLGGIFKFASDGTVTRLYSFKGPDGARPSSPLIRGNDGAFYGTTSQGGTYGKGRVFKITASGVLTSLHDFNGADGENPFGAIIQDDRGDIYGTTYSGTSAKGAIFGGTIFKISQSGQFTILHEFGESDGSGATGGVTMGLDGNIYGTTLRGGELPAAAGTIFRISRDGDFARLYTFTRGSGGMTPRAALIQDRSGVFYGTTGGGGALNLGTIFKF